MPSVLTLKTPDRQLADAQAVTVPEVDVFDGGGLVTAFGGFQLRKRLPPDGPPEYRLRPTNSAGYTLLTGQGDVFAPDLGITAVDDEDATRQVLRLIWNRAVNGLQDVDRLCREWGLPDPAEDTPAEAAALSAN